MIPLRIKVKGFLCYKEEQEIDFGGATTLWMLSGLNGSGKSAIFDAVTYALFGHHRGGGQQVMELINKDSDSLLVEFDFLLDQHTYRVKRTVKRRANNTSASTQQIFVWQGDSSTFAALEGTENKRDGFDPWIRQHIGLTYETFTSSVLLLQGKAEKLLDSRPEGRREVLASIVDLERYERLHKLADDQRRSLDAELKTLQSHLDAVPEILPLQMEEARGRITAAEETREQSRRELERLQALEFEARAWQELQGRLLQASERLARAQRLLDDASTIERDVQRMEELRQVLPRLETISTQNKLIHAAQQQVKTFTAARDASQRDLKTLESQLQQLRSKREVSQQVIAGEESKQQDVAARFRESTALMEQLKEFEQQQAERATVQTSLARLPADPGAEVQQRRAELDQLNELAQTLPVLMRFQSRREELRQAQEQARATQIRLDHLRTHGDQLNQTIAQVKLQLDGAQRDLQQANEQVTTLRTRVQQARESLDELNTLDGASKVCRACGQPITPNHIADERRRRSTDLASAEANLRPALTRQQAARQAEEQLRQQFEKQTADLQEARAEYRASQTENKQSLNNVKRLLEECAQAHSELAPPQQQLIGAGSAQDWVATRYPGEEDLRQLRTRASGVAPARTNLQRAEQTLQQWQGLKTQETLLAQTLSRLQVKLPTDPREVRRKHTTLELDDQTLKKSLATRRAELKEIEKETDRVARERDQAREKIDHAVGELRNQELHISHAHDAIAATRKLLPSQWIEPSEKAGISELAAWTREVKELEQKGTEKRSHELKQARLNQELLHQEKAKVEAEQERFPPEARVEIAVVQARLAEARKQDGTWEQQLMEARQELALLENQQQNRSRLQQRFLEKDGERNVHKLLAELLGKDRLQLYLVRQAERKVVEYANAVLDRLSGGQLYLRLSGEAEGEGNTARALELEAYNRSMGDKPINVAFLSGSQKFRVAVSLALGIGQYASHQHRPIESVIIDEGFGCLDRQGRQVMIQELQNLRGHMRCILLVSHQEEFADAFNDGYHFELENGATRVRRVQK